MIEQGTGGSIVLIASISGHTTNFPQPQVSYNVSKAGVIMTAKSLAAEWGRYRIRVNTISPGYMDTILNEGKGLDEHKTQWYSRTPLGRMGGKDELNGAVILLCSEAGSFITGTDVKVDGKFGPFSPSSSPPSPRGRSAGAEERTQAESLRFRLPGPTCTYPMASLFCAISKLRIIINIYSGQVPRMPLLDHSTSLVGLKGW